MVDMYWYEMTIAALESEYDDLLLENTIDHAWWYLGTTPKKFRDVL